MIWFSQIKGEKVTEPDNVALQQTTNYHFFQTGAILKLIQVAFSFMDHNVLKSRDTRLSSDLKTICVS
jgi:hypothetical protein